MYVADGNDIESLIQAFVAVKDCNYPIALHINTLKGKGFKPAEEHKEPWHWGFPFDLNTGESKLDFGDAEDYGDLTAQYLLDKMKTDRSVVAITSGTPTVFGFTEPLRKQAGKQFVDVGIAEEHAVALASGIAAAGGKPVYGVYSSFIQRTYDQLSQDLCINNNSALILVYWGSIMGLNDVTHLGLFDIPLISNIPNMVYLAPTTKEEYFAMMQWGIDQTQYPVAIRVPGNRVVHSTEAVDTDYSELNRYKITQRGTDVAILGLGSFYQLGHDVVTELKQRAGIDATLINPRYITGTDDEMLSSLMNDHKVVVTLEDGILDGGFGEKIARFYGPTEMKVLNYGARKEFVDRYDAKELLEANRLTKTLIADDVLKLLK